MNEQTAKPQQLPLDELMLAMDVVDTLRHRSLLVDRELASEQRDQQLMDRLRKIYAAQGIDVPDHVLEEGVAALAEDRFVYKPRTSGFRVMLARLYVSKGAWGVWVLGALIVVLLGALAWYFLVLAPRADLPEKLDSMRSEVVQIARTEQVDGIAEELYQQALVALRNGDEKTAREGLGKLFALRKTLEQSYTIEIVNQPDQFTGVWRVPDLNPSARNYYIVVEAKDPAGETLEVSITNEESGEVENTVLWALRVEEAVFKRIIDDKQDDGIIQNRRFGAKRRGQLEPEYDFPTTGAAITSW